MIETLSISERAAAVFSDGRMERAFQFLKEREAQIEEDQIRITLVPAPPFQESERARLFGSALESAGFAPVLDSIGNVITPYNGIGKNPVVVAAHLDTVFPDSQVLSLRRKGRILYLPGISDNG